VRYPYHLAVITAVFFCTGCIASNVIALEDRAVTTSTPDLEWQPAITDDIPGLYESTDIQGEASGGFWKIYYLFEEGGRYAAAALVPGDRGLEFQSVNGTWQLRDDGLVLDGGDPISVTRARGFLQMESSGGLLVLRASELR